MSTTKIRFPRRARQAPRLTAVVLFPTPPFWLTIATVRGISAGLAFVASAVVPRGRAFSNPLEQHFARVEPGILGHVVEQLTQNRSDLWSTLGARWKHPGGDQRFDDVV